MALAVSYFAWVRERMGIADEVIDPPADVATVADLIGWLATRDERGALAFADPARIRAAIGGRMVGLLVDAVSDILQMSDAAVQPTPDVASDRVKTFVQGILSLDGRMISLIDLEHILPQVEAEAA